MSKVTIITLGESGVGKTTLLNRFRTGKFRESIRSTFVDHFSKTIKVENVKTNAVIWDTAGQERYNSLIKRYYAMADGVLLMYDINNALTFSKLSRWLGELKSENENAEIILVGNKNEDPTKRLVSSSDVQNFIEKKNMKHIEASAKTGENVDLIFQTLVRDILASRGTLPLLTEQQQNSENDLEAKSTSQLSSSTKEPEISFTYFGKSEVSNNPPPDESKSVKLHDEDISPNRCFLCRCF